jgi:hypothetical protein
VQKLLSILRRRAADEKPIVRRAAILAMEALLLSAEAEGDAAAAAAAGAGVSARVRARARRNSLVPGDTSGALLPRTFPALAWLSPDDMHVLFDGCRDAAPSVRKQAAASMTALLLRHPESAPLQQMWLGAVLPLTGDREAAVADRGVAAVKELIFDPLCTAARAEAGRAARAPRAMGDDNGDGDAGPDADAGADADAASAGAAAAGSDDDDDDEDGAGGLVRPFTRAAIWPLLQQADATTVYHLQRCVAALCARGKDGKDAGAGATVVALCGAVNSAADASLERGLWIVAEELSAHVPQFLRGDVLLAAFQRAQRLVKRLPDMLPRNARGAASAAHATSAASAFASPFAARPIASAATAAADAAAVLPVQLPTADDVWDYYTRVLRALANTAAAFTCAGRARPSAGEAMLHRTHAGPGLPRAQTRLGVSSAAASPALELLLSELRSAHAGGASNATAAQVRAVHALCCAVRNNNANLAAGAPAANCVGGAAAAQKRGFRPDARAPVPDWEGELAAAATAALEAHVVRGEPQPDAVLIGHLFALGELALVSDRYTVPAATVTLVQTLMPPTLSMALRVASDKAAGEAPLAAAAAAVASSAGVIPTPVRAHAFIALGKLCLTDLNLAKRLIGAFVAELDSPDPVIRNNVVVVLCDLCRTFTSVVDPHIPALSRCLRDPHVMVRRHVLMVLTQLLTEDFVKLRGSLLFRLLACVVDPDPGVRALARQSVSAVMQQKRASKFHRYFVEAVYFFNGCYLHSKYNQLASGSGYGDGFEDEDDAALTHERLAAISAAEFGESAAAATARAREADAAFTAPGARSAAARMEIYRFLLSLFDDTEKITITTKLVEDVLGACAEGVLPLPGAGAIQGAAQASAQQAASVGGLLNLRAGAAHQHLQQHGGVFGGAIGAGGVRLSLAEQERQYELQLQRRRDAASLSPAEEASVMGVVSDALTVLCSDEIRIQAARRPGDDDDEPVTAASLAAAAAAAGDDDGGARLSHLLHMSRAAVGTTIFPIVMELKRQMEGAGSLLIRPLMVYFRKLAARHRGDLETIIPDHVVRSEVLYDIRKFEELEREKERERAEAAAEAAADAEQAAARARADPVGAAAAAAAAAGAVKPEAGAAPTAASAGAGAGTGAGAGAGAGARGKRRAPTDEEALAPGAASGAAVKRESAAAAAAASGDATSEDDDEEAAAAAVEAQPARPGCGSRDARDPGQARAPRRQVNGKRVFDGE